MKVTGNATLNAPADKVWATILDPAVLARTIPGCERLETTGPDRYRGTITAGVASIKGTFLGDVELTDLEQPSSLVLRASGAGGPGTVKADVAVRLADLGDGRTELTYDADAVVGGMVGGVGQRVLTGVARKMAGEFFTAIDGELTGRTAVPAAVPEQPAAPATESAAAAGTGAAVPATFPGRAAAVGAGANEGEFVKGAVFGAAIAFAGVLIGVLAGRRRKG
ncbi:hypothetical protein HDA32_001230 [Spinactinospora alkalitolerans]|uniref:Carbon monoxide dehydrogenase n=1 Tax=Spinactinospora alkalitolerans TaxID=687207 RepID=A0A852TW64_9ACTN|nr:carbon monoxide dehydrogenase subunit G [Spinactinospora alkalitolerans]NYE46110.1 hypothetical protein [Spinactinospora alkalitolerans]